MGEVKDRAKGFANETIGKAKRGIGEATNRPDIKAEGNLQEAKGDAQKAKGRLEGAINR